MGNKYLLLTKFEGHTVSEGLHFSTSIYGPSVKHEGHKLKKKRQGAITYSMDQENGN